MLPQLIPKYLHSLFSKFPIWIERTVEFIPNILAALIILVVFNFLARYAGRLVERIVKRSISNEALMNLLSALVRLMVILLGVGFALGALGLEKTVMSMIAGAGVLALALGFAFQDLATNFISGTFIAMQQRIRVGDVVETNGFLGRVRSITLNSVRLDNFAGQQVEIPSKDIFQKPLVNYSVSANRRIDLVCGVAYDSNLTEVEALLRRTISALPFVVNNAAMEMVFTDFADSSITFLLQFWIEQGKITPTNAKSEAIKAIKNAFDENHILIPFPVRTLDIPKDYRPLGNKANIAEEGAPRKLGEAST